MSTTPQPSEPDEATTDDAHFRDYLQDLLDVGAEIAQDLKRQAKARAEPPAEGAPPHPTTDLTEPFERLSRAMRRTVLLARHIAQLRTAANEARPATNPTRKRTEARKRLIREVEDLIQRNPRHAERVETLNQEFRERLDSPDLEEDIANRPIADIITDIVRDLDVVAWPDTHPWCRRTPRDIADLNARAAKPTPSGPYNPGPHGPEPGARQPKPSKKPPDPDPTPREPAARATISTGPDPDG